MQAMIMAAGKGSRIGELTDGHPKSFLEINGEKLIDRNVRMLRENGIKDIIIVTGYRTEEFEEMFSDDKDIHIVYNPFYEMTNVIGSFYMGMNSLHDDFMYLHADTICEESLLKELIDSDGDIILPVDMSPCDDEAMKVKMQGENVIQITKKMIPEEAVGEFIGIAKINKKVINDIQIATKKLMMKKAFSEYFEAAIQVLIEKNTFHIRVMDVTDKFWAEIDFKEDYERAKAFKS